MTVPGQFDDKDRAALNDELTHIEKHWWVFSDRAMVLGFAVGLAAAFYFDSVAVRVACALMCVYCATQFAYRMGVYFGFSRGFEQGHEEGVRRANGPLAPPPP